MATSGSISEVLAGLLDRDPACEDRAGVGEILSDLNRLAGWVEARRVRCARRLRQLEAEGRSESTSTALLDESRKSAKEAKAIEERERVCAEFPALESALAGGAVSSDHLDVLARLTRNLSDRDRCDLRDRADEVVAAAGGWVSEFERTTKHLIVEIRTANRPDAEVEEQDRLRAASHVKRWTDQVTGLHMTLIALDPLRDATLHNVVAAQLAQLRQQPEHADTPFPALHAQAVVDAITGNHDACVPAAAPESKPQSAGESEVSVDRPTPRPSAVVSVPEVVIHVDLATLCHGRHPTSVCETIDGVPIPPATVERLCCEAVLQAVVVKPDGSFDQLCQEYRTASRAQRRALAAMYSTCAHPDCRTVFSACRIHHVVYFSRGGKSVLDNMIPLCERHHHLVHEGGWTLSMTADRVTTWTRPDGAIWWTGDSRNRLPRREPPEQTAAELLRTLNQIVGIAADDAPLQMSLC